VRHDGSVLQCVVMCCRVLQYDKRVLQRVAVFCSMTNVCCSVLQCVAVSCSVLQCLAVCCSVLHLILLPMRHNLCSDPYPNLCDVTHPYRPGSFISAILWQCVAVCCSVLQCVAVCCSVLQCVALDSFTHAT